MSASRVNSRQRAVVGKVHAWSATGELCVQDVYGDIVLYP
jgi:hypothetical protein